MTEYVCPNCDKEYDQSKLCEVCTGVGESGPEYPYVETVPVMSIKEELAYAINVFNGFDPKSKLIQCPHSVLCGIYKLKHVKLAQEPDTYLPETNQWLGQSNIAKHVLVLDKKVLMHETFETLIEVCNKALSAL